MKKKFIAVSMVLGALALSSTTLTSCVDDNESASVTAIRDAKAKQLTALAGYYDAQAAYQQAEANYRQAMADKTNQETAQDAEQWAYELEKIQKEYEQQIAMYEQQIADYKNQLATNMDTYQGQLFTNYENAVGKVNEINSEITNNLYLITQLKNELASLKATAAKLNYADQLDIAAEKAKIEVYKQMAASNLEDLKSEFATLEAQITEQTQKEAEATRKLADAKEAFKQEVAPIRGYTSSGSTSATADPTLATSLAIDSLKANGYFYETSLKKTGKKLPTDYLVDDIKYAEGAEELGLNSALLHQYSLKASAVTTAENLIAAEVYEAEKALGASTDAATGSSIYAQYNAKGEAVKTAQTAYNNALKGTDKDAIEQARKALNDAIAEQERYAEDELAKAIKAVEEAKDLQVRFENVQKAFTGDTYKAYETAITTALAGENAKAMVAAQQESNSIALTKAQLEASKTAINTLIGSLTDAGDPADVNALILASEATIAEKEKNIANRAKYENTSISDQDDPAYKMAVDDAVAMLEAENEQLKVKLTAAEARVEAAKAALDAEFGSSASTDTPATETPAE